MTKSVLYLSYDGMTDPLGQSQVLPYLNGLHQKGYKTHLISFEKPERFKVHTKEIQALCLNSNISWHPKVYHKSPPVFSTLFDLYIMLKASKKICKEENIQLVHCRSYLPALIGLKLKTKFSIKFLFDIRGFWIDERVDGGLWSLKNPIYKFIYTYLKKKEKLLFQSANAIVSLTAKAKEMIIKEFKTEVPIRVIPCATDLSHFKMQAPEVRQAYREKLSLQETDFALVYVGSIGSWYMLDEMLYFYRILLEKKPSSQFFFFTQDEASIILTRAKELKITPQNLSVLSIKRSEMPSFLSAMDASVFFIKPCFSKHASSPTKHGELLAMHLPCVYNEVGDLKAISQYANNGILVKDFSVASFNEAADQLLENKASNFEATVQKFYSLEKGVQSYVALYQQLLS